MTDSPPSRLARAGTVDGYARLGLWTDASQQYERVQQKHPHPEFALGHAQAELRLGNKARASEILATVQSSYSLDQKQMEDVAFLKEEMRHAWGNDGSPREVV